MRWLFLLLLSAGLLASPHIEHVSWKPIPPEVWALKEHPAHGIQGAVILEDSYAIGKDKMIRTYRVRILSEAGRDAANLFIFAGESPKIEGHTLYPSGASVEFDSLKDFSKKPLVSARRVEAKRTVVVAPGITGDCILEARWEENPLGQGFGRYIEYLGGRFLVQRTVIRIAKNLPRSYMVFPGPGARPEVVDEAESKSFTLWNLPAREEVPFALDTAMDLPRIVVFDRQGTASSRRELAKETDPLKRAAYFWNDFAVESLKPSLENGWFTGSAYRSLKEELFKDLPQTPIAQASLLLMRLNARIRNYSHSTFAEVAADKGIQNYSDYLDHLNLTRTQNLNLIAQRGATTNQGMWNLYFYLLREAGIKPLLGLVADRNLLLLHYTILDTRQCTHLLIGVEEKGKGVLWLDPTLRFAMPGLVLPQYQGTEGVMVDTGTWRTSPFMVPVQSGLANQRQYQYRISLDDDGESFSVSAGFSGFPEYFVRDHFMALDGPEENHLLKQDLEQRSKSLVLTKTEVLSAQDPLKNVSWRAEGHLDMDPARERKVQPFPSQAAPLEIPEVFPANRIDPIILPYRSIQLAVSLLEVPSGYQFRPAPTLSHANRFGSVHWVAVEETKGGQHFVRVTMRVDVTEIYEKAEAYGDLKAFCSWIQEALHEPILLESAG